MNYQISDLNLVPNHHPYTMNGQRQQDKEIHVKNCENQFLEVNQYALQNDLVKCSSQQRNQSDRRTGLGLELTQMRRKQTIDFSSKFKQICDMPSKISPNPAEESKENMIILQTELLNGLRAVLLEKLSEEESYRHKMLKEMASRKQQHSSVLTKTTAANSISSALPKEQQMMRGGNKREIIVESNTTSQRCSISINNLSEMSAVGTARTEYHGGEDKNNLEIARKECQDQASMIQTVEQALIPLKNERNQILEHLEDVKEELIVSKQYLRDITYLLEKKKKHNEDLIGRINSLSRTGHSTINRDYLSQSQFQQLNSTRMMNTSFVDEAVGKFKAVKDFFKVKLSFGSNSSTSSSSSSNPPLSPHNYGSQSSRMNSQNQIPMTNRFLDFN